MSASLDHDTVREYYGRVLASSADLRTGACCPAVAVPAHIRPWLADVHPEVAKRFHGCGSPLPPAIAGCTGVDFGCGPGSDAVLLSRLVGAHGRLIGIDMAAEQLDVARRHREWQADRASVACC